MLLYIVRFKSYWSLEMSEQLNNEWVGWRRGETRVTKMDPNMPLKRFYKHDMV